MLTPAMPPQPVPVYSGFDYVTVDAQRRRVYAAHGGAQRLLIADADTGKVVGQVRVGECHGVAVNPATGHVYVGVADDAVDEIDPVALKVVNRVATTGPVDAIAFDATNKRIYADEDDGTHMFIVDAATFKLVKTLDIPGHKPEYLAVDPATHDVYQNIDSDSEIAVVDAATLTVSRTIKTPEIRHNHPLQYDPAYREIVVAGGGVMSAYTPDGTKLGQTQAGAFDQCDLDPTEHMLACAGGGGVTRYRLQPAGAPKQLDTTQVAPGVHTLAVDPVTHAVFVVWADRDGNGDYMEKLVPSP